MGQILIRSGGTAASTEVLMPDGSPIPNIARIVIAPIEPGGVIKATLDLIDVRLELAADQVTDGDHG